MRISDLISEDAAGVGRVVKGVNTSPDVGPGEIRKQAKKFGLKVDNDGRPPIAKTNGSDALREEVWDQPNPKKKSDKLTPSQKARAKARAKRAGRPYPNLVDNMWASKLEESSGDAAMDGSNISVTGTEKAVLQRKLGIRPGTPEWFRLWFARPYLTDERPVDPKDL